MWKTWGGASQHWGLFEEAGCDRVQHSESKGTDVAARMGLEVTMPFTIPITTWIVVAHRAGATIFNRAGRQLEPVRFLDHPEGRLRDSEINSDRSGATGHQASPRRNSTEPFESPHDRLAGNFARDIAELLTKERAAGRFDDLIIIAPPPFLGRIRSSLDSATKKKLRGTIGKDIPNPSPENLQRHLAEVLPI